MRFLLLLALLLFVTEPLARPPTLGDEVSGEAYVVWKAVADKVSQIQPYGVSVKAKLELQGRTREGNQIRGSGVLRCIGDSRAPERSQGTRISWTGARRLLVMRSLIQAHRARTPK
jgi:hypothetical protein